MTAAARSGIVSVRILGGRWRGRRLEGPASARPTSGRARQALFNVLAGRIPGARVLDLFAGTGAIGLEAVSRGAATAVLVETRPGPLSRTLERIGAAPAEVRLVTRPASVALDELARRGERFDVVFADPPYDIDAEGSLARVGEVLGSGGIVVLQQDRGARTPDLKGLGLVDQRPYGRNVFRFFGML